MSDFSGPMTIARASIVALRLQGMTLAALVQQQILTGAQAAAMVRDAASYLSAETNDPTIQKLYQDTLEQIAADLNGTRPTGPTRSQRAARQRLS